VTEKRLATAGAVIIFIFALCSAHAFAQETVFNVPSGDVLDHGKVYGELDIVYQHSSELASFTPRIVTGIGGRVEIGLNFNGLATQAPLQTVLAPTIKWKAYDGGNNGWAFLLGDDLFFPLQNRAYNAGNYSYAEFTKNWGGGTRATFGVYHFTRDVVSSGQRVGGQFAIEQALNKRVTVAADWYTGNQALGFVTPGVIVKVTPKLTWYGSYQLGNHDALCGNHQFLTELGWNFN
jgi:hypothetical protein